MPCTMLNGMKYELLNVDFLKCFKLINFLSFSYIAWGIFKLKSLLSQPPKVWDDMHVTAHMCAMPLDLNFSYT